MEAKATGDLWPLSILLEASVVRHTQREWRPNEAQSNSSSSQWTQIMTFLRVAELQFTRDGHEWIARNELLLRARPPHGERLIVEYTSPKKHAKPRVRKR